MSLAVSIPSVTTPLSASTSTDLIGRSSPGGWYFPAPPLVLGWVTADTAGLSSTSPRFTHSPARMHGAHPHSSCRSSWLAPRWTRSALTVAEWLEARPEVERVLYPPLPSDPGHAIWVRDFAGASGLMGVVLAEGASEAGIRRMMNGFELFGIGASWGGFESLVLWTQPEKGRTATTWPAPGRTLRFHVGLEDPGDLIADLEAAFHRLGAAG